MVRLDSDGKYAGTPRSAVSRSACLRRQNATRSSSMPRSGEPAGPPGASVSRCAARKSCRTRGIAARAVSPRSLGSIGTSRQPSRSAPSTSAYFSTTRRARASAASSSGRKTSPVAYSPAGGKREVDHRAQERVRHLDHDAGAVAGVRLRTPGAPVVQPTERAEPVGDDRRVSAGRAGPPRRPRRRRRAPAPGRTDPGRTDGSGASGTPAGCAGAAVSVSAYG